MSDLENPAWRQEALRAIRWSLGREALDRPPADDVLETLRLKRIDAPFHYAWEGESVALAVYRNAWNLQRAAIERIGSAFSSAGLRPMLFKGAPLIQAHNGGRPLGLLADIDIIVPRQSLVDAMAVLYSNGLKPAQLNKETGRLDPADIESIALMEAGHYQLPPFRAVQPAQLAVDELRWIGERDATPLHAFGGDGLFVLEIDVHHRTASDVDLEPFLDRLIESPFADYAALAPADHLWTLMVRYYNEVALYGKTTLRELIYCGLLIGAGGIEWRHVIAACDEYRSHPACYYLLRFFHSLAPDLVPGDVVDTLRVGLRSCLRDFGWQLGKLFDFVEAMPLDPAAARWREDAGVASVPCPD